MSVTAQQAWSILMRHAKEDIAPLRLQELCRDTDRVSSLVAVYNSTAGAAVEDRNRLWIVDMSRQRMTVETLHHLLKLSTVRHIRKFITQTAWGQNDPTQPALPARVRAQKRQRAARAAAREAATAAALASQQRLQQQQQHPYLPPIGEKKATRFEEADEAGGNLSSTQQQQHHQQPQPHRGVILNPILTNSTPTSVAPGDTAVAGISGGKDWATQPSPSMHMALRVPTGKGYEMLLADGTNALMSIHDEWDRLKRVSDSLRKGIWKGVTGSAIKDVIVIGRGVPLAALQFVYTALLRDEKAVTASRADLTEATAARLRRNLLTGVSGVTNSPMPTYNPPIPSRRCKFLSSVDPVAAALTVSDLDPASTLVISIALMGNEETGLATKLLKSWLLQQLGPHRRPDHILSKHMMLVTANDHIATVINKPESVYLIPEHSRCEAFTSFSAATLLPLSIVFGWPLVQEFLAGAHDMDCHFVDTNPRHNLPVLLALTDIWNDILLGNGSVRAVTPYTEAFASFPAFVAALESQTCSGNHASSSSSLLGGQTMGAAASKLSCSSLVLDGGRNSALERALYQGSPCTNVELVMAMDTQIAFNTTRTIGSHGLDDVYATQDALMCSLFAHADGLALGTENFAAGNMAVPPTPGSTSPAAAMTPDGTHALSSPPDGNRPSLLLLCGKLDAFACGQLLALSEHRALVKAQIWGLDPFTREVGSSLRMHRTDQLKEEMHRLFLAEDNGQANDDEDDGRMNLSTRTILSLYANLAKEKRAATASVKGSA